MRKIGLIALAGAALFLGGCAAVSKVIFHAPTASTTIQPAAGGPVERVFDCAQKRMDELQTPDAFFWKARITRRDLAAGILETGDFQEDNIIGFRLRLEYQRPTGAIHLFIKGAGPYFTDLGVDDALTTFKQGFDVCLTGSQSPPA